MTLEKGKTIYLTDRSAVETDDQCGMKFWWNRLAEGTGVVPVANAEALAVGAQIHEDMALVAELEDLTPASLDAIVQGILSKLTDEDKQNQHAMELLYRRIGWFTAWALFKEPEIRAKWQNTRIEGELILDRSPLWVQVTPDRLMVERSPLLETGTSRKVKYLEYKTTISASKKWTESWRYAIQLHTSLAAVQEEFGQPITYGQVVGLLKGSYSLSDNRLTHPYVWGYYNASSGQWTHDYSKSRSAAWTARPVWEYEGGVVKWVQSCGQAVADNQFPTSPPIFLDQRMLNQWIRRRIAREQQINAVKEICLKNSEIRDIYFESRTNRCKPAFGDHCPYLSLCWNAERGNDPLGTGDFVPRVPHHDLESIGVD